MIGESFEITDKKGGEKMNKNKVPQWEEWESLSSDQKEREIFNLLTTLNNQTVKLNERMEDIDRIVRKYAFGGGIIGGIATGVVFFTGKSFF